MFLVFVHCLCTCCYAGYYRVCVLCVRVLYLFVYRVCVRVCEVNKVRGGRGVLGVKASYIYVYYTLYRHRHPQQEAVCANVRVLYCLAFFCFKLHAVFFVTAQKLNLILSYCMQF